MMEFGDFWRDDTPYVGLRFFYIYPLFPKFAPKLVFLSNVKRFTRGRHRTERSGDHVAYRLVYLFFFCIRLSWLLLGF